jgi:hypothetical protein
MSSGIARNSSTIHAAGTRMTAWSDRRAAANTAPKTIASTMAITAAFSVASRPLANSCCTAVYWNCEVRAALNWSVATKREAT